MQPQADLPEGLPHIRRFKYDSQQVLSSPACHLDGIVSALGNFEQTCPRWPHFWIASSPPDETSYLSISSPRCQSLGSLYSEPVLGRSGPLILPPINKTEVLRANI